MKKRPVFETELCVSCGICAQACPVSSLSMSRAGMLGKYPNVYPENDENTCIGCGMCARACPMEMIRMEEF